MEQAPAPFQRQKRKIPTDEEKRILYDNGDKTLVRCTSCDKVVRKRNFAVHKCPKRVRVLLATKQDDSCPPLPEGHVPRKCAGTCGQISTAEARHLFYRKSTRTIPAYGYQKGQFAFMLTCNGCNSKADQRTDEQRQRYAEQGKEYRETRRGFLTSMFGDMQTNSRTRLSPPPEFIDLEDFIEWCALATHCNACGIPLVFARTDPDLLHRQASPDRNINEAEARVIREENGSPDFKCYYRRGDFVLNCRWCQFARNESSIFQMQDWIATLLFGHPTPEHPFNPNWAPRAIGRNESSRTDSHQGNRLMEAFNGHWVKEMYAKQQGLSASHLGRIELHRCTTLQCPFRISVDRIDNADKEHRRDNCALVTFAENSSKLDMRKDLPMTNRRWQLCVIARIEHLLSLAESPASSANAPAFIREQLRQPGTEMRLTARLCIMEKNLCAPTDDGMIIEEEAADPRPEQ